MGHKNRRKEKKGGRRKKEGRKEGGQKQGRKEGGRKKAMIRVGKGSGLSPWYDKKDQEQAFTLFFPERSTMTSPSPNKY